MEDFIYEVTRTEPDPGDEFFHHFADFVNIARSICRHIDICYLDISNDPYLKQLKDASMMIVMDANYRNCRDLICDVEAMSDLIIPNYEVYSQSNYLRRLVAEWKNAINRHYNVGDSTKL